jgi:hypothetical protein
MLSKFTYHLNKWSNESILEIYMDCRSFRSDGHTKLLADKYNIYSKRIMNHTITYVIQPLSKEGMISVFIE